uniref:HK97 gp10 family phage protein n=1 Tax=Bifidobacterium longum TaxID=216816 RepID=UPI0021FA2715|nr:MAG: putative tail-component [Bacteriophage sp.]
MAAKAAYVVGQKRFVQTMRKAGADMKELKEVNRQAANIALPAVRSLAPRGKTGRLAGSIRAGATQKAGIIRAGRKTVPYAGPINYGWPARNIRPRTFVNDAVASTESQWAKEYETFVKKTMNQIKGA